MKTRLLSAVIGTALLLGIATAPEAQAAGPVQISGAEGLAAIVAAVQANNLLNNNQVMILDSSFNNWNVLNNVLNNSTVLSHNNIDVSVLSVQDVLNNNTINTAITN